jgi:hypothetical protein
LEQLLLGFGFGHTILDVDLFGLSYRKSYLVAGECWVEFVYDSLIDPSPYILSVDKVTVLMPATEV